MPFFAQMKEMHMKKPIRNLIIFAVATLGCGFLGVFLDRLVPAEDPMKGLGVLLWLPC